MVRFARNKYNWYYQSLTDHINWNIQNVRRHFSGRLLLMGGGFSARSGAVEAEINDNLSGNTKDAYWVSRGFVPDRYLAGLENRSGVAFVNTAVERSWRNWGDTSNTTWEDSPLQSDWSQPHYYSFLADRYGMEKFAENGGGNNAEDMDQAFINAAAFGYLGLAWYTIGQLFEPANYASIKDYADRISSYGGPAPKPARDSFSSGWETSEVRGYDNVVCAISDDHKVQGLLCTPQTEDNEDGVTPIQGSSQLMAKGDVISASPGIETYVYYWLFNDVLNGFNNVAITKGMKLTYWVFHINNKRVSVDFHCTDETELRNQESITDQDGVRMHPAYREDPLNQWHYVEVDLSPLEGKTIDQVNVGFGDPSGWTGQYRSYIDDLQFTLTPTFMIDDFNAAGSPPAGWRLDYNADISSDGSGTAIISLEGDKEYGDVISPVLHDAEVDVNIFDTLTVKIDDLSPGTYFDIGLQEESGQYRYFPAFAHLDSPGIYRVLIADIRGDANLSAFSLKFWLNGVPGESTAVLDYVELESRD